MKMIRLTCDKTTFADVVCDAVRWLDWDADYEMARRIWPEEYPLAREVWEEARRLGYRYCAIVEGQEIVAVAAEYRFSEEAWMLAAVRTAAGHRRRGLGKQVCAFVTAHILAAGRLATCDTGEDNLAMIRTAQSIGFRRSEPAIPPDH